jgi:hypothetical protein
MSIRNLISKFLTQLCEKNYSEANNSLGQIVEAKTKAKVAKIAKEKDESSKPAFLKKKGSDKKTSKTSKKPVSAKQAAFLKKIGATKKTSQKGKK